MLLLAAACGQTPGSAVTSPSPSVTPSGAAPPLFAVLEANGSANPWQYNTVAIAGLDGRARATATFTPMPVPTFGCVGSVIPPSAHVAAGKVYYADGRGVVRSLAVDGAVTKVAAFPLTSNQQMLSFAVSPDGTRIVGTVFTAPSTAFSCTGASSGTFTFDAYAVTSPASNRLVYHRSWTSASNDVMALAGWDSVGPFGTYPTVWASQGGRSASSSASTPPRSSRRPPSPIRPAARCGARSRAERSRV